MKSLFKAFLDWFYFTFPSACNVNNPKQIETFNRHPISVRYHNGEVEYLQLEMDIKIDSNGLVYMKKGEKSKWIAYPEISDLSFTTDGLRRS